MSFVQNEQIGTTHGHQYDNEETTQQSTRQTVGQQDAKPSLEEEIYVLRNKMEQVICDEDSLTSKRVVQHSSELDRKINEYMRQQRKIKQ